MLSEEDKKALLNGAYGISRNGCKCKFINLTDTKDSYTHFVVYFNDTGLITHYSRLTKDFVDCYTLKTRDDVVGLWEDKPEPFNLERALLGEPVMTRDRSKAYVQAIISQPKELEHYNLIGFGYNGEHKEFLHWDKTGKVTADDDTCDDIIGMWREPEPVSKEITVTLPRALREPKDEMWFVDSDGTTQSGFGKNIPRSDFERIPYFGAEAHAKAWFDAMQDSRNT